MVYHCSGCRSDEEKSTNPETNGDPRGAEDLMERLTDFMNQVNNGQNNIIAYTEEMNRRQEAQNVDQIVNEFNSPLAKKRKSVEIVEWLFE